MQILCRRFKRGLLFLQNSNLIFNKILFYIRNSCVLSTNHNQRQESPNHNLIRIGVQMLNAVYNRKTPQFFFFFQLSNLGSITIPQRQPSAESAVVTGEIRAIERSKNAAYFHAHSISQSHRPDRRRLKTTHHLASGTRSRGTTKELNKASFRVTIGATDNQTNR
uniref:(northern house mosquito) hypothetical protein n=1 Tax=Culex pipiens TaxID=7175 RepID=A0A8D8NTS2_CULPI